MELKEIKYRNIGVLFCFCFFSSVSSLFSSLFFLLRFFLRPRFRLCFRVCFFFFIFVFVFVFFFLSHFFFPHFFRIIFLPCFFRISFFLNKKRNAHKEKVLSGYVDGPRLPGDGNHRRMGLWRRNSQVLDGNAQILGNVFGGGNKAIVSGNSHVIVQ